MARITFSLDEHLAAAAEQVATGEKRSLSSYISILLERDLDARGKLPGSPIERVLSKARIAVEASNPDAVEAALNDVIENAGIAKAVEVSS